MSAKPAEKSSDKPKEERSSDKPKEEKSAGESSRASTKSGSRSTSVGSSNSGDNGQPHGRQRYPEEPIMVKRGATGTVKFFSYAKRYGFIDVDPEEGEEHSGEDSNGKKPLQVIFVHFSSIVTLRPISCILRVGDKLEFDISRGLKGLEAVAVTMAGGFKVPGLGAFGAPRRRFNGPPPSQPVNRRRRRRSVENTRQAQQSQSGEDVSDKKEETTKEEGKRPRANKRQNNRRRSAVSNATVPEGEKSESEQPKAAGDNNKKEKSGGDSKRKQSSRGKGSRNKPRSDRQDAKKDDSKEQHVA